MKFLPGLDWVAMLWGIAIGQAVNGNTKISLTLLGIAGILTHVAAQVKRQMIRLLRILKLTIELAIWLLVMVSLFWLLWDSLKGTQA